MNRREKESREQKVRQKLAEKKGEDFQSLIDESIIKEGG